MQEADRYDSGDSDGFINMRRACWYVVRVFDSASGAASGNSGEVGQLHGNIKQIYQVDQVIKIRRSQYALKTAIASDVWRDARKLRRINKLWK